MFLSIIKLSSTEMQNMISAFYQKNAFDLSELNQKRPPIEIRRLATHALALDCLLKIKAVPPNLIKKVKIQRRATGEPYLTYPPEITNPPLSISISHTGPWIACLLSDKEMSACIDLEDMNHKRPYKKLAEYAFSAKENQFVSQNGELGFYQLWTAKEALAKCQGKGLRKALNIDLGLQLKTSLSANQTLVKVDNEDYFITQQMGEDNLLYTIAYKALKVV